MKILITAGATREPIDSVRFISNVSSGRTGASLADNLAALGHTVVFLHGEGSALPRHTLPAQAFTSADNLRTLLAQRLRSEAFDVVIMAAAIADYRPATPVPGKLASEPAEMTLYLVRNPKILPQVKSLSPTPVRVVGFKLTVGANEAARAQAVHEQFAHGHVDVVVHNDLAEIRAAPIHPFRVYASAGAASESAEGVAALAGILHRILAA